LSNPEHKSWVRPPFMSAAEQLAIMSRDFPPYLLAPAAEQVDQGERILALEHKVKKLAELGHVMLKVITLQEMEIRALYDTLQRMGKQTEAEDPETSDSIPDI
jgi:hypothetical protein